jgi:hypothetical protein
MISLLRHFELIVTPKGTIESQSTHLTNGLGKIETSDYPQDAGSWILDVVMSLHQGTSIQHPLELQIFRIPLRLWHAYFSVVNSAYLP